MSFKDELEEILDSYHKAITDIETSELNALMWGTPYNNKLRQKVKAQATTSIINLVDKEIIGLDNEYHEDMPIPDPDPFALPSDHQNQLRRYQRAKLKEDK